MATSLSTTTSAFIARKDNALSSWNALFRAIWGAGLIALSARVSVPLMFSPVPLSFAPQVVCWLAWGHPTTAFASVLFYLFGSGCGLPLLFSGQGGWMHLVGPRGGYLVGYLLSAWSVAFLRRTRLAKNHAKFAPILAIWMGSVIILGCGYLHLASLVGCRAAWELGVVPFLVGDLLLKGPLLAGLFKGPKDLKIGER